MDFNKDKNKPGMGGQTNLGNKPQQPGAGIGGQKDKDRHGTTAGKGWTQQPNKDIPRDKTDKS